MRRPRVAIIGAGMTGLCTLRFIQDYADVTLFEARDDIGGQFHYVPYTEHNPPPSQRFVLDHSGYLPSSVHADLSIKVPTQMIVMMDHPMPPHLPQFLSHAQLKEYLQSYVTRFRLKSKIKLLTYVISVSKNTQQH